MRTVAAHAVAKSLLDLTDQGFETRSDPYGLPWIARADQLPHPILEETGDMRRNFFTLVTGSTIKISNVSPYGEVHQFGNSRIPQRAFFPDAGLPAGWASRIDENITIALKLV